MPQEHDPSPSQSQSQGVIGVIKVNTTERRVRQYWNLSSAWRGRIDSRHTIETMISGLNDIWTSAANHNEPRLSEGCQHLMDMVIMNRRQDKKPRKLPKNVVSFPIPMYIQDASQLLDLAQGDIQSLVGRRVIMKVRV